MITEERFGRLEDKVDHVKEDLIEIKGEMKHMGEKFHEHIEIMNHHIAGDQKIIDVLEHLIPDLSAMTLDYNTKKKMKEIKVSRRTERMDKWRSYAAPLGVIATLVGIVATVSKVFA